MSQPKVPACALEGRRGCALDVRARFVSYCWRAARYTDESASSGYLIAGPRPGATSPACHVTRCAPQCAARGHRQHTVFSVARRMMNLFGGQRAEFVQLFKTFDKNGDNVISLEELMEMLCRKTAAGNAMFTEEDAREHLSEFDQNGDGQWQVDEFIEFMLGSDDHGHGHAALVKAHLAALAKDADDFHALFKHFDKNADSTVSIDEIIELLCTPPKDGSPPMFTKEDAREHLEEFDANGDGTWQVNEFVAFMLGTDDHGHGHAALVKKQLRAIGQEANGPFMLQPLLKAMMDQWSNCIGQR